MNNYEKYGRSSDFEIGERVQLVNHKELPSGLGDWYPFVGTFGTVKTHYSPVILTVLWDEGVKPGSHQIYAINIESVKEEELPPEKVSFDSLI